VWAAGAGCCREEEPTGPHHRLTAGRSPEDGEFVSKKDDLQLLAIFDRRRQPQPAEVIPRISKPRVKARREHEACD